LKGGPGRRKLENIIEEIGAKKKLGKWGRDREH